MKNTILIFFFLLIGFKTIAQETIDVDDIKVHTFVQRKAEPKEGIAGFYQSYSKKFNSSKFSSSTGTLDVRLKFIVEKDGTFSDIQVLNESNEGLGEEAIRVLKTMPAWKPATHKGKIVRSVFRLPMKIRADEKTEKSEEVEEKSLSQVLEKKEAISQTYLKSLDNFLVNTDLFEFRCNCTFVKNDHKKEYRYESQDGFVYYQISIEKKDAKEAEQTINDVKSNMINQGFIVSEIQLSGNKAVELTINTRGYGPYGKSKMIILYNEGYFIGIIISSEDPQIADAVTEHFKQTFKLKL
ncbi:energy transducer TonB [Paenimyroides aestuarii]|uniref:Energy transducer TonB n=1 Tax=Paenimyroides aestuarii TaxID=2968490 RepID=A0ABY5NTJ3_9FLAO|nr:energy transducer TonB [Paenimyroides aestuarii]UUV21892.1 energy transducer TonB [Paenimyroides aestuarii]